MKKLKITVNGKQYDVVVEEVENENYEALPLNEPLKKGDLEKEPQGKRIRNEIGEGNAKKGETEPKGEAIKAPMAGTIVYVKTENGKKVSKGEVLLILEAMKMENEIVAPFDGEITHIKVKKGDSVNSGEALLFLNR